MQQPVQSDQHQRQRNKLHKPADPRGHGYTDSGVGMTRSVPIEPSTHEEPNWNGPDEAVGGGTYVRDYAQPTGPPEPTGTDLNTGTTPAQHTESDTLPREEAGGLSAAAMMGGVSMAGPDPVGGSDTTSRTHKTSGDGAPYWGNLPSGANGAVHNTVSGHGSATDDHEQHHHLPPTSTSSDRSVIAGHVANYPRGGVYNTVTGHGSQDQEATHHNQPRGVDNKNNMAGVVGPTDDTMLAAPLPDIPEERQKAIRQPILLPETAVRGAVLPAEAASRDAEQSRTSGNAESAAPRAFPLVGATTDGSNDQRKSTSPSRYGAAAGAAGLGAGPAAAAAGYLGQQRGRSNPPDQDPRQCTAPNLDNTHQAAGAPVTGKGQPSQQRSPAEKPTSHDDESPKGEKKHRILGIFHRNKDEGKEDAHRKSPGDRTEVAKEDTTTVNSPNRLRKLSKGESAMGRRRSPSSAKADPEEQSSHGKEMAAAGAAAGAGAFGFLHHRKKKSTSENPKDTTNPTLVSKSVDSGGTGPAGETLHQVGEVSTPFEHPREPPMPPPENEQQPGNYNVLATGTPSGISHGAQPATKGAMTNEPRNYHTLASGTASGINSAHPETTRQNVVSSEPGGYNVLGSSGKPPVEGGAQDRSGGRVTQEPGHYNTLASGVPSGINRDSSVPGTQTGDGNTTTGGSRDKGESTEYNVLPSGTISGVKVKPKSPRHSTHTTDTAMSSDNQHEHGQYNTLASGTASGQQQQHTFPSGAPIPSHLRHERAHPNASQESVPGITSYSYAHPDTTVPPPQQQQHMSPEVMPDAYTASTHPAPVQQEGQQQHQQQQQQQHQEGQRAGEDRRYNPALAAAGGVRGVGSGRDGGVGGRMARCRHCGGENDISEEVERVVREMGMGTRSGGKGA
ncbi:uncharacterized protein B0H64DRAFT_317960 [Chaetomium fimeti]|uniref:Uncharacterized protein n=1 Tax=Chaetomium fimeti TaxID=1854472 RepID=A0AAE0LVZ1_9PEZI|nr:hypothetical protein B0H64DRAFT_317960 [Chaetomium fimeti]